MPGGYAPAVNPNNKLYNAGSEWQNDIDGLADYYSTYYREYDPVIGRFNNVDPMAAATDFLSVYHYAGNSPVNFNDPLGDLRKASSFANARELFEYVSLMGTNSIDYGTGKNSLYMNSFGDYFSSSLKEFGYRDQDEIEKKVVALVQKGEYLDALKFIIATYQMDAGMESKYYARFRELDNFYEYLVFNSVKPSNKDQLKAGVPLLGLVVDRTFLKILDPLQREEVLENAIEKNKKNFALSFLSFGDVVSTIWHEFNHIADRLGKNELNEVMNKEDDQSTAEREFRSYHLMHINKNLPYGTLFYKTFNWMINALDTYYLMSEAKQKQYADWHKIELDFLKMTGN